MISPCTDSDTQQICEVINEASKAYLGVIPGDCWHEPYMSLDELQAELAVDVSFVGYTAHGELLGVMGSQAVHGVTLIRHAYVRTEHQGQGIGHELLTHLLSQVSQSVLVGTWSAATWAIIFYERHGFKLTSRKETRRLLHRYWSVPERQIQESTVLVGPEWTESPI